MFAKLQRGESSERVRVFTRADNNGIEIIRMIKDATEVGFLPRLRMLFDSPVQIIGIHVAKSGDVFGGHRLQIPTATAATANDRDSKLIQRRSRSYGGSTSKQSCRKH
jgi:hypothetical protein